MVVPGGIEPPTQGFSVLCSTDWAMKPNMAVPTGLEPAIFCVTGRRVNQLHHGTMVAGGGLEPPTSGLWAQRATNCSIPRYHINNKSGGGKGIRTPAPFARPPGFQDRSLQPDLGIPPKQWCLRPDLNRHEVWPSQDFKSCASTNSATQAHGDPHEIRTHDPLIKSQMLYRLS